MASRPRVTASGALTDKGAFRDYRTQKGSEIRIRRVTVARGEWFAENLIRARSSVFRPWLGSSPGSWTGGRPQKADERTVPQPSCVAARSSLTILVRLRPQEGENGEHAAVVVRCGWECEPFLLVTAPRGVGPSEQPYRTGLRRTQLRLILRGAEHYTFSDFASTLPALERLAPGLRKEIPVGSINGRRALAIERRYLSAFFRSHLKGTSEPLLTRASPSFPEVSFERGTH